MSLRTSSESSSQSRTRMNPSWRCNVSRRRRFKRWTKKATTTRRSRSWMRSCASRRSNCASCRRGTATRRRTWSISTSSWSCSRRGAGRWCCWLRKRRRRGRSWSRMRSTQTPTITRPTTTTMLLGEDRRSTHKKSWKSFSTNSKRLSRRRLLRKRSWSIRYNNKSSKSSPYKMSSTFLTFRSKKRIRNIDWMNLRSENSDVSCQLKY